MAADDILPLFDDLSLSNDERGYKTVKKLLKKAISCRKNVEFKDVQKDFGECNFFPILQLFMWQYCFSPANTHVVFLQEDYDCRGKYKCWFQTPAVAIFTKTDSSDHVYLNVTR